MKTKNASAKKSAVKKANKAQREISVREIIAHIKKGSRVLNHAGKSLTPGYMANMQDKDRKMPVTVVKG